jgi:hypothetical protein
LFRYIGLHQQSADLQRRLHFGQMTPLSAVVKPSGLAAGTRTRPTTNTRFGSRPAALNSRICIYGTTPSKRVSGRRAATGSKAGLRVVGTVRSLSTRTQPLGILNQQSPSVLSYPRWRQVSTGMAWRPAQRCCRAQILLRLRERGSYSALASADHGMRHLLATRW